MRSDRTAAIREPLVAGRGAALRGDARRGRRAASRARRGPRRRVRACRSQGAAGLRRSEQPSVLQREGRGLREQDHGADGGEARQEARLCLVSAGDRLRAQHARRPPLRRDPRLSAGRRARADHQSVLPHGLCARHQAGHRARRPREPRRSAAQGEAHRHRRRHAARHLSRDQRPDAESQALSAGGRHPRRFVGAGDDARPRERRDRRRRAVGSDGGVLCQAGDPADAASRCC